MSNNTASEPPKLRVSQAVRDEIVLAQAAAKDFHEAHADFKSSVTSLEQWLHGIVHPTGWDMWLIKIDTLANDCRTHIRTMDSKIALIESKYLSGYGAIMQINGWGPEGDFPEKGLWGVHREQGKVQVARDKYETLWSSLWDRFEKEAPQDVQDRQWTKETGDKKRPGPSGGKHKCAIQ